MYGGGRAMSDQEEGEKRIGPDEDREGTPIVYVVKRTSRFSKEVIATMISLASAAFGVVAALAWNTAITELFNEYFGDAAKISAFFIYAVVVTLIGVIVIVILGRIAARIQAQPVEFRYPAIPPKS
jgi:tetrahydromethanopterin S-methyltransferase subunit C